MNVLAESKETIVLVPIVLAPIQVQVPLAVPPVQIRDVAVAVRIPPVRALVR